MHCSMLTNFNIQVAHQDFNPVSKSLLANCSIHPGLFVFYGFCTRKLSLGSMTLEINTL